MEIAFNIPDYLILPSKPCEMDAPTTILQAENGSSEKLTVRGRVQNQMLTSASVLFKFFWADFFPTEVMHTCNQQHQKQRLLAIRISQTGRTGFLS